MKKTNIYEFPQAKGVVVSSDIHGDFTQLVYKCCVQYGMPNISFCDLTKMIVADN